jgi:hypothetical protein
MEMRHVRLRAFRRTGLSALGVIGSCLGVYAVLAVAFHALVEPSLGKSYAANEAPAVTIGPSASAPVARPPSVAATPRPSFTVAALPPGAAGRTPGAKAPNLRALETTGRAVDAATKTGVADTVAEAKNAGKSTATRTRHRQSRDHWNSFGFLFGASFGPRR